MALRISDLQSDSDLDNIRNSCDVFQSNFHLELPHWTAECRDVLNWALVLYIEDDNYGDEQSLGA